MISAIFSNIETHLYRLSKKFITTVAINFDRSDNSRMVINAAYKIKISAHPYTSHQNAQPDNKGSL